jgi:cyclase
MANVRLIARLDVKAPNLIKGVHLEGLRKIGDPQKAAQAYYEAGVDEIIYMDIVASLYNRSSLHEIVRRSAQQVFVPITVGGGIRSLQDVEQMLRSGADKVAINTAAVRSPQLLTDVARRFGSQCMVLSIEAKRRSGSAGWEAFTDNGREHTSLDVVEWAKRGIDLGAGEILLTSVDREGTRRGFDLDLVRAVSAVSTVPVIVSGGMGTVQHLVEVVKEGGADAVAMADVLHYNRIPFAEIRSGALASGIETRQ